MIVGFQGLTTANSEKAYGADLTQFNAGNIISDEIFYNGTAMSASEVQNFLNSRVPTCTINNGQPSRAAGAPAGTSTRIADVCLKDYRQATPTMGAQSGKCAAYQGKSSETAAEIIANVGRACNVSQKVLLVLLEKEQSLVSDSWPSVYQYTHATGFACYDNGQPCVSSFNGFFYQVWAAAKQFQAYGNAPFTWYPVGRTSNILYQANNPGCGTKSVYIENRATAALYYYTPYTPNAASLAAGYGRGDTCSSYGNRNFYQLFVDWFGSTQRQLPLVDGTLESVTGTPGQINISGWALYPRSQTSSARIVFAIDGTRKPVLTANTANTGSNALYPAAGTNHGFTATYTTTAGAHTVCAYLILQNGSEWNWGCRTVTVPASSPTPTPTATATPRPTPTATTAPAPLPLNVANLPIVDGTLESVTGTPGQINISGWALYPRSQTSSARIVFAIDGTRKPVLTANTANTGSNALYPAAGTNHGFTATYTTTAGAHTVCAYLILQNGSEWNWGCRTVTVR